MKATKMVRHNRGSINHFIAPPDDGDDGGTPGTPPDLVLNTINLTQGFAGVAYSTTLTATGGVGPYSWSVVSGSFSGTGLSLSAGGVISGTPTSAGTITVTIRVTDSQSVADTAQRVFNLQVNASGGATTYDGVTLGTGMWLGINELANDTVSWGAGPSSRASVKLHNDGVDFWVLQHGRLAGWGGYDPGGYGDWSTYPLTAENAQTHLVGRNQQWGSTSATSGIGDCYLGIYMLHESLTLTDDAGWTRAARDLKNLCRHASDHNAQGIGIDWEEIRRSSDGEIDYSPAWVWRWQRSGLTESASRALAFQRGFQIGTAMAAGWNLGSSSHGLRIINYDVHFSGPGAVGCWRIWVNVWVYAGSDWYNGFVPENELFRDFWRGFFAADWYRAGGGVWFLADAFYKAPYGGQPWTAAGWDYALAADKAYHRNLFNTEFGAYASKIGSGPFGWVADVAGENPIFSDSIMPSDKILEQFDRFGASAPDGIVGDYHYDGGWGYNYSGVSPSIYSEYP